MVSQVRHSYEFGPLRLIPEERQLLRENRPVPLTPKSFDLLVVLVENNGHLLEKGELMKRIWPESFVEEANLSVNVSALRRALGEGPNEHQYRRDSAAPRLSLHGRCERTLGRRHGVLQP